MVSLPPMSSHGGPMEAHELVGLRPPDPLGVGSGQVAVSLGVGSGQVAVISSLKVWPSSSMSPCSMCSLCIMCSMCSISSMGSSYCVGSE